MDLNPINVLSPNPTAPPAAHTAPSSAKRSFADILSAQPQATARRSTSEARPGDEDKEPGKKVKVPHDRDARPSQLAVNESTVTDPAFVSPTPAATPRFPIESLPKSLSLNDGATALDPVLAGTFSEATSAKPPLSKDAASGAEVEAVIGQDKPETRISRLDAANHGAAAVGSNSPQFDGNSVENLFPADTDLAPPTDNAASNQNAASNDSEKEAISPADATPFLGLVASTAPTHPINHEDAAGKSSAPVSAPSPAASSDQPLSALTSAAERVGAVVSAAVRGASQKLPAARSAVSALKAAIAPGKSGTVGPPQMSESGLQRPVEIGRSHNNSEKHTGDPAPAPTSAATESQAAVDESSKDAVAPAIATTKDGTIAASTNAPAQAAAPPSKNGVPSSPAGSATPESAMHADPALAQNRSDTAAGMELSGLSKATLIDRFRQSELHFGMQSGEFGHIEVRTLLDRHELTARISVERGDLGRVLESELPDLHKRLSELDVPMSKITLHEQSPAMSGESGRRSREQDWQAARPAPASGLEPVTTLAALLDPPVATEGLSIRI